MTTHRTTAMERDYSTKARSWATFWSIMFKVMLVLVTGMTGFVTTMTIRDMDWKATVDKYMATMSERIANHVNETPVSQVQLKEQELKLVERINTVYTKLDERDAALNRAIVELPSTDRYSELLRRLDSNSAMLTEAINFIKVDDERDKRVDARLEKIETRIQISPSAMRPINNRP